MVFAYYHRLSKTRQAIYRQSDRVEALRFLGADAVRPTVLGLATALEEDNRAAVQANCQQLADAITTGFKVPRVKIKVLARRPHTQSHELHGLYESLDDGTPPRISVWMRTAARKQVVAFRTFLRTLLHELCHHLDYTLLQLGDSYHTEGFYKRESSLFHQLVETSHERQSQVSLNVFPPER